MAKLIKNYGEIYGITSIAGIITRYAPTDENNTKAYISHVSGKVGLLPYAGIKRENYLALIKAMVLHENGMQPYDDDTILKGIELAGRSTAKRHTSHCRVIGCWLCGVACVCNRSSRWGVGG